MTDTITLPRATVQQALEALEKTMHAWGGTCAWHRDVKLSITALRTVLEQQQQAEPVAQRKSLSDFDARGIAAANLTFWHRLKEQEAHQLVKLFIDHLAPPQQQAEPVAWIVDGGKKNGELLHAHEYALELVAPKIMCKPLYTTPPQRKPLTIAEVEQILAQHNYEIHGDRARYIVRMTEEAHGIKEGT